MKTKTGAPPYTYLLFKEKLYLFRPRSGSLFLGPQGDNCCLLPCACPKILHGCITY